MEKSLENSSESVNELGRGLRKRRKRKFSDCKSNESSETSCEEEMQIQPQYSSSKYHKVNRSELNERQRKQVIKCFLDEKSPPIMHLRTPIQLEVLDLMYPDNLDIDADNTFNENTETTTQNINLEEESNISIQVPESNNNMQQEFTQNEECLSYKKLFTEIIEIKLHLKRILEKVCRLESKSLLNNSTEAMPTINCFSQLPLKTTEDLLLFDESLKGNEEMKTQFKQFLINIGGSDAKNFIYRSFVKLITNKLGMNCSWTGMKNNFKLGDLTLIKLLQEVCINHFKNTEKSFEMHVREWLRNCAQRHSRELKKCV